MGKSIRSKRKKRLRTLKRELAEPHYDRKDAPKFAAMEAALQAPKIQLSNKKSDMDVEPEYQGRSGAIPMMIDEGSSHKVEGLKVKGSIKKRGKSKSRLKKDKHRQKKLNF